MKRYVAFLRSAILAATLASASGLASDGTPSLVDRFKVVCPTSVACIAQYDKSISAQYDGEDNDLTIWAAVYRSNNNQPSVLVRDELMQSMRLAVDSAVAGTDSTANDLIESPMMQQKPVAIASLSPSQDYEGCWVLDNMRCDLKKEDTNSDLDGGSEHCEAISAAIDALLLQYLVSHDEHVRFEGAIRTKGTLVSGILLEDRGFVEVSELSRDMATHVSSLDACLEQYMARTLNTKAPAARDRALNIVSHLGRLDREADLRAAKSGSGGDKNDQDDYDPWAGIGNIL